MVAQLLTDPFELISGPDKSFEPALEMACEKQPVLGFDLEAVQDRREVGSNHAAFVLERKKGTDFF